MLLSLSPDGSRTQKRVSNLRLAESGLGRPDAKLQETTGRTAWREGRVTNEASFDLCLRFQMLFVFCFYYSLLFKEMN